MKKLYILFAGLFSLTIQLKAQAPNSLNYQGVARNASGLVLPNQGIGLRFTIHQGSIGGAVVYQETQAATTNLLGLFTVAIGSGVPVSGTFATIGWSTSSEFLQVEMDPTAFGGTSYLDMGTNQFLSVPYAISSGSSASGWNIAGNTVSGTFGTNFIGTTNTAPLEFYTNNAYSGVIDATKANVYFGNIGNSETTGNTNTGSQNVGIGEAALGAAGTNSNSNVAIGNFSLWSNTGSNNISGNNGSVAIGGYAMKNSTGNPNTAIGYQANYSLTSGVNNVAVGYEAGWSQTTGSKNVAIGDSALDDVNPSTNASSFNTAIGTSALVSSTGNSNTGLGYRTLRSNTTGSNNMALGYKADVTANNLTNATAIGSNATVGQSNSLILGSVNGVNGATANTTVGIGTNTPNAGAALDITSSSQGLLIPRMAANPTAPATGMMYYNTATGCFMFYTGSAWNAMVCPCPNTPGTPGTITSSTGSGNFCPSATGVVYSVTPVSNAISYTWSTPSGATITGGQGSNSITVTEGTTSSSISVTAVNNCATGAASTLALTVGTATTITTQPASTAAASGGNATFSVVAAGSSLTYQWQLGGVNIPSATNTSYTVSSVTTGMNGNQYRVVVTGSCGSTTSNAATLSVCSGTPSYQIALKNNAGSATSMGLQVMVSNINLSTFTGVASDLSNIEFTTGPDGTGTPLYAWIESGSTPTATTSTETAPTTSSTNAVIWVNLGSTITINAGATVNIYMSLVSGAINGTTGFTGIAPQWTSTYGASDNGLLVFPSFYDNFAGTGPLASKWTNVIGGNGTLNMNNNVAITKTSGNWFAIYTNTFTGSLNNIADSYCKASNTSGTGACINTNGVDAQLANGNCFGVAGTVSSAPGNNGDASAAAPVANTFYVLSFIMVNPAQIQLSYGLFESQTLTVNHGSSIAAGAAVGIATSVGPTGTFQWFRIRSYPPSGLAPAVTATYGCY